MGIKKEEQAIDIEEALSSIFITPTKQIICRLWSIYLLIQKYYNILPGNYCERATPDPIPNSEVKSFSADGTLS